MNEQRDLTIEYSAANLPDGGDHDGRRVLMKVRAALACFVMGVGLLFILQPDHVREFMAFPTYLSEFFRFCVQHPGQILGFNPFTVPFLCLLLSVVIIRAIVQIGSVLVRNRWLGEGVRQVAWLAPIGILIWLFATRTTWARFMQIGQESERIIGLLWIATILLSALSVLIDRRGPRRWFTYVCMGLDSLFIVISISPPGCIVLAWHMHWDTGPGA